MTFEPVISDFYDPLEFGMLTTRYAIVTGGRGSGKSFAVSTYLLEAAMKLTGKTILFTRYTMVNAEISIMPEFFDKIDKCGWGRYFAKSGNDLVCSTGTRILFRGIKTSTGVNTAALKSIPNLVLWVNDESEELVDETTFDTIDLSIRDASAKCAVWLILNPSDTTHFIYRRFFSQNGVEQVKLGSRVINDVTYIHTTYKQNPYLPQDYVDKANRLAETNPDKYRNIWLGHWAHNRNGLVFPDWEEVSDAQWPQGLPFWYGLDWGFSPDPTAIVRVCFDAVHQIVYWKEVAAVNETFPDQAGQLIIKDAAQFGLTPGQCLVYCDSANNMAIGELRVKCSINAAPANKKDREYQISWMHGFRFRYIGDGIRKEVQSYSYEPDKNDRSQFTRSPQEGNDHFMDAGRYGTYTHLQRMGVATSSE